MPEDMTGKIKRKFLANFINAALPSASTPKFVRLGDDLEEYTVELNANVESKENILGETSVILDSYKPQASVEPYYAKIGDPMFERLQTIIDDRQTLDELKTEVVEVHLWKKTTGEKYEAYKEDAIIEVTSYGGSTAGYQIPFNVHHTGNRTKGVFDLETKTFTADSVSVANLSK